MEPAPEPNVDVNLLAAGEPAAWAALYARLARRLLRVAGAMLGDAGDAEDAVHDVFVALARGRERLRYVEDLDAYVFASLRHAIAARTDRRRFERRHWERLAIIPAPASHSAEAPDEGEVSAALAALAAEQREVVVMKIDGGLTFAQIAAALSISPNTAASRYRYAMAKLRKLLEDRT
jgi:RNA polymerase sigma-70 factor (ECF subfamily)